MFDIGFFELLIIAVVGLVVIGPERLPGTVRTCGLWLGRIKRSISDTRREIEQQLGADEIRRELRNEEIMRNLERMQETRDDIERRIRSLGEDTGDASSDSIDSPAEHKSLPDNSQDNPHETSVDQSAAEKTSEKDVEVTSKPVSQANNNT